MRNIKFAEPILTHFKPVVSETGWKQMRVGEAYAVINGILAGIALLALLPAATTLARGGTSWGLDLKGWIIFLAVCAVVTFITEYRMSMVVYMGALDFMDFMHERIGSMIARIPLGWFKADSPGMFSRMVSKEMIQTGETIAHLFYPMVRAITSMAVITIGCWVWDWRLGLVLTIAIPIMYLLVIASRASENKGKEISFPTDVALSARVVEYAKCQGALRSCGRSQNPPHLREAIDANYRAEKTSLWWSVLAKVFTGAFAQIIIVAMIFVAAWLATTGRLGPIESIAFIGMSLRFMETINAILESVLGLEDRRLLIAQMDEVMATPLLEEPAASAAFTEPGAVELEHVRFGYDAAEPVINDVSFRVPPRTMTALVGPSGCGKTTIARLIARFYDANAGTIRVSGVPVQNLTTESLMGQLSMVFQDVYLFDDTLEANIRIGRDGASEAEVRRAAELAGVDEIVARLPHGYQTRVGEGGRALSGGERQRVSVARALLKRAPIVLFDEATSALDAENEANIVASMEELRKSATLIVIAHKLETIKSADQVIVFNQGGEVVQAGTHYDLLAEEGAYRGFWLQREKAQGWQLV